MAEIVKVYKQVVPPSRFIGIKYFNKDRVNGNFGSKWEDWFKNQRFEKLEVLLSDEFKKTYDDVEAYIGLMRYKEDEEFEYWIGMFLPLDVSVPEGFEYVDFPASNLGVCYVKGFEYEIYCQEEECAKILMEQGYEIVTDEKGSIWFFERYGCPRFATPDNEGKIILDICHFIK